MSGRLMSCARPLVRVIVAALAAVLLVAPEVRILVAGPPQEKKAQERPLRHDAAAVVKLVTVRVLGQDGRPVAGLRKEDFTLFEDGRRKAITEFEVHALSDAGMTVAPGPPSGQGAAAAVRSPATNRKIFFFVDQQESDRAGKEKARVVALRFLDTQVKPGDEMAVIGFYSMTGFYIREYLTTDKEKIRRAINGTDEIRPSSGEAVGTLPDTLEGRWDVGDETHDPLSGVRVASVESAAVSDEAVMAPGTAAYQHVDFVPRMEDLAEVFKTIPGTKSLVMFTARNMGPDASRLGKLFGAAGTAVYAVNTRDWDVGPFGTRFKKIWWDHSLKDMSAASGGAYFADINESAAIADNIQGLTGQYYVLGYYVTEAWEGKYHKIRVDVTTPESRVLVQDGYYEPKPFDRLTAFERAVRLTDLLWSDRPAGNPLSFEIDPLVIETGKTLRACLMAKWDVGDKAGPPAGRVEIEALLRDETGKRLVARKWESNLDRYAGRTVLPYLSVEVPAGACDLHLVVRDLETGEAWIGRAEFSAAAWPQEGVALATPLLFEEGRDAAFMRLPTKQEAEAAKGKAKSVAEDASLVGLYRLVPKAGRPIVGEIPHGTRKLALVLPFEIRPAQPGGEPMLGLEARLIDETGGRDIPLEIAVKEHAAYEGRPDVLVADILFPELTAGTYQLEISLEDVGTERRGSTRKTLVVR